MHHAGIYSDEVKGKVYDAALLKRFLKYLKPHRKALLITLFVLPLVAGSRLLHPVVIKLAIDNNIMPHKLDGLYLYAVAILSLLLLESTLSFIEVYLLQSVGQKIMSEIREELFLHLTKLPVKWFDKNSAGAAVTRVTSDVEALGEMFASGIITIVGDIILLVGIVSVMLWMNLKLSLVTFTLLPILAFVTYSFRKKMRLSFRDVRSRLANLNSYLAEAISGISIIQIFNKEHGEKERFSSLNGSYRDANMPVIFWDASLYAIVEALSSIAVAMIIWYAGGEIVKGVLTFGVLVAFIQYIEKFFSPIRDLSAKYSVMQGAMAALERIFHLIDIEEEKLCGNEDCDENKIEEIKTVDKPIIEFRNVTFSYRESEKALENFSLSIKRGEKVALVGESGGGKTTVTRLLSRFYDVDEGEILIEGVSIKDININILRRRIAVVMQDPAIFAGTIAFNISLGDEKAAQNIRYAAELVGADKFIEKFPKNYEEEILEKGGNLSTGEKQLISFARAVAFNPEILLLDEATANVDSESEQMIQRGIEGMMQGRTSLVVAHRLSTIKDADKIVVIHGGKIVEEGSHEKLMQTRGRYFNLQQLQRG